jgi:hypothetical protein
MGGKSVWEETALKIYEKYCLWCGRLFTTKRKTKKYCCQSCQARDAGRNPLANLKRKEASRRLWLNETYVKKQLASRKIVNPFIQKLFFHIFDTLTDLGVSMPLICRYYLSSKTGTLWKNKVSRRGKYEVKCTN